MRYTEEQLIKFTEPLSSNEDAKCLHSIGMVRDSLIRLGFQESEDKITRVKGSSSFELRMNTKDNLRKIKIFVQGSYANNTNIKLNSDVDIAVVCEDSFYPKYRENVKDSDYHFVNAQIRPKSFKDEVCECLKLDFGRDVERRNKSIFIKGNTYRQDTDTVPAGRYRDYTQDYSFNPENYIYGIRILTDEQEVIINYPEQHILNGVKKNNDTNYYYKKMVRIFKNINLNMMGDNYESAENISSFCLESLIWNVPNHIILNGESYGSRIWDIMLFLLQNKSNYINFYEANGIKKLFKSANDVEICYKFISDMLYYI